jgi:hypothetical protein
VSVQEGEVVAFRVRRVVEADERVDPGGVAELQCGEIELDASGLVAVGDEVGDEALERVGAGDVEFTGECDDDAVVGIARVAYGDLEVCRSSAVRSPDPPRAWCTRSQPTRRHAFSVLGATWFAPVPRRRWAAGSERFASIRAVFPGRSGSCSCNGRSFERLVGQVVGLRVATVFVCVAGSVPIPVDKVWIRRHRG